MSFEPLFVVLVMFGIVGYAVYHWAEKTEHPLMESILYGVIAGTCAGGLMMVAMMKAEYAVRVYDAIAMR